MSAMIPMLRWVVLSLLWRRGRGTCRRFVVLSSQRSGTELLASLLRAGGAGMRTIEPLWHCRTKKLKKSSFAAEAAAAAWGGAASPAVARSGCEGLTLASDDNDACGHENLTGFTLMYSQLARGGAALEDEDAHGDAPLALAEEAHHHDAMAEVRVARASSRGRARSPPSLSLSLSLQLKKLLQVTHKEHSSQAELEGPGRARAGG